MSLIRELVKKGILNKKEAKEIQDEAKNSFKREEELILEKGLTSEDFLFQLKSSDLKIPLKKASSEEIPLKTLETIPEESARYYKMIPLQMEKNKLEVGMVYPEDLKAREALEFLARQDKFDYDVFLITATDFERVLKRYKTLKKEVGKALEEFEAESEQKKKKKTPEGEKIEKIIEEAPISKVVAVFLRHAVDGNASDVHIEPGREKVRVRFRLDGILHASLFLPLEIHAAVVSRIKILCNLKIDESRIPQDGRFSTTIGDKTVDFRVSTFPTTLGEKVVIRILDSSQSGANFESLGIVGRNLDVVKKTLEKPYGMILSTGPTGSGKSTTLYAILGLLNKEGSNVITLEDPVEYFVEGINQSQVKPEIGYDFASGLRHILRQDPDILMVGEIRDEETATLAIHAALTGHMVLSTLHTSNSIGVIPRFIDMGIKPFLIPPTLSIAIAQRLIRKLCPHCKKKVKPKTEIEKVILKELENLPQIIKKQEKIPSDIYIYEAAGCSRCNKIGFSGRIGLFEILEMTDELADIILRDPSENDIWVEAKRQGMVTMRQDGILKVLKGITSVEEVMHTTE